MELSLIASLPEVIQAAVADDAGRLLGCAGDSELPTAAVLVLAHATLSAASEQGRRSGSGDCLEIVQMHEAGVIYLHSLPQHRLLLVRCQSLAAIPTLRSVCEGLAKPVTERVRPVAAPVPAPAIGLADALHAPPEW